MTKHLILLALPTLLLSACASMERSGPPAPIVESSNEPVPQVAVEEPKPEPEPAAPSKPEPTRVYAYTPPEEIREQPAPAASEAEETGRTNTTESEPSGDAVADTGGAGREPQQSSPSTASASSDADGGDTASAPTSAAGTAPTVSDVSEDTPAPSATAPPAPEVATASAQSTGLAPADMPPAVSSLANRAEQQRQSGDSGGAAATLERALRIQPQEPYLWNRLARVRLEQGMGESAEKLATRSNALTGDQPALKTNNWEIIATARRQSGDLEGAVEAERKAAGG